MHECKRTLAAWTKTAATGGKLTPFPTFHSARCSSIFLPPRRRASVSPLPAGFPRPRAFYLAVRPLRVRGNRERLIGPHRRQTVWREYFGGCLVVDRTRTEWPVRSSVGAVAVNGNGYIHPIAAPPLSTRLA
jgi:hypothetical protein